MLNFIGELFVRSNVDKFLTHVLQKSDDDYSNLISTERHIRFGACLDEKRNSLELHFHVSLLQSIMTEDFKLHVVYEDKKHEK